MSAQADRPTDGDRVRFCLSCGEVVPFDVRACPACGHYEAVPTFPTGPQVRCGHCEAEIAAGLCFCPGCGRETAAAPPFPAVSEDALREDEPGPAGALAVVVAWAAPLSVLAALAFVVGSAR